MRKFYFLLSIVINLILTHQFTESNMYTRFRNLNGQHHRNSLKTLDSYKWSTLLIKCVKFIIVFTLRFTEKITYDYCDLLLYLITLTNQNT